MENSNWQEGVNLWRRCEQDGEEGLEDRATECFLQAWEEDRGCVEALLGLHYFLPEQKYDLLAAIEPHASELTKSEEIYSYYNPLIWKSYPLQSEGDFRRAWAKELAWNGEDVAAREQLLLCPKGFLTDLTRIDLLFHSGEYDECLRVIQKIDDVPEEWDFEIRTLNALVLRRLGLHRPALRLLHELLAETSDLRKQLFVLYEQGLIMIDLGEDEAAQSVFEEIYSRDTEYRNVAELIGRKEDPWAMIVEQLTSGPEASDPTIPDNL